MSNGEEYQFNDKYTVSIENDKLGDVGIVYSKGLEDFSVHADFQRAGDTVLTLTSPIGEKTAFSVHIERSTFNIEKIS